MDKTIKRRIKKIESFEQLSGFCLCYGRFPEHAFILVPNVVNYCQPLPDFCHICNHPVDKSKVKYPTDDYLKIVEGRLRQAAETMEMFNEY